MLTNVLIGALTTVLMSMLTSAPPEVDAEFGEYYVNGVKMGFKDTAKTNREDRLEKHLGETGSVQYCVSGYLSLQFVYS